MSIYVYEYKRISAYVLSKLSYRRRYKKNDQDPGGVSDSMYVFDISKGFYTQYMF